MVSDNIKVSAEQEPLPEDLIAKRLLKNWEDAGVMNDVADVCIDIR